MNDYEGGIGYRVPIAVAWWGMLQMNLLTPNASSHPCAREAPAQPRSPPALYTEKIQRAFQPGIYDTLHEYNHRSGQGLVRLIDHEMRDLRG